MYSAINKFGHAAALTNHETERLNIRKIIKNTIGLYFDKSHNLNMQMQQ